MLGNDWVVKATYGNGEREWYQAETREQAEARKAELKKWSQTTGIYLRPVIIPASKAPHWACQCRTINRSDKATCLSCGEERSA